VEPLLPVDGMVVPHVTDVMALNFELKIQNIIENIKERNIMAICRLG